MEKAISELEEAGVDSYILDLRNNPVRVMSSYASKFYLSEDMFIILPLELNVDGACAGWPSESRS